MSNTQSIWQNISADAIVGIIGTLLGTVIGWFLNELSNRGKITIFLKTWKDEFYATENDRMGGYRKIPNNAQNYEYKMTLEIHNSSNAPKIVRDAKVGFGKKKKVLQIDTPKDDSTRNFVAHSIRYDDLGAFNVPAHEVVTISIHGYYSKKNTAIDFLRVSDSVWFIYKGEKNRIKKRLVKRINYDSVFEDETEDT